ncbi:MAG: hypothetical protein H6765_00200 [Candidatus Peribacteria bacterium]|nr:MAG: hypothetical protein H6765_00200 [Candidatus Peribacteria bacterium]
MSLSGASILVYIIYFWLYANLGYANRVGLESLIHQSVLIRQEYAKCSELSNKVQQQHPDIYRLLQQYGKQEILASADHLITEFMEEEDDINFLLQQNSGMGREQAKALIGKYKSRLADCLAKLPDYAGSYERALRIKNGKAGYLTDLQRFVQEAETSIPRFKSVTTRLVVLPRNTCQINNWLSEFVGVKNSLEQSRQSVIGHYQSNQPDYFKIEDLLGTALQNKRSLDAAIADAEHQARSWNSEEIEIIQSITVSYSVTIIEEECYGGSKDSKSNTKTVTRGEFAAYKASPELLNYSEHIKYVSSGSVSTSSVVRTIRNGYAHTTNTGYQGDPGYVIRCKPRGYSESESESQRGDGRNFSGEFATLYQQAAKYVKYAESPLSAFSHSMSLTCYSPSNDNTGSNWGSGGSSSNSNWGSGGSSGSGGGYYDSGTSGSQNYNDVGDDY